MPERYHIHTVPTPGRFRRVGKFGTSDWREDCSRCKNCVKLRCLYSTYASEAAHNRDQAKPVNPVYECKACLSCVQGCTKGLLSLTVNPEFLSLGDSYWRPDILFTSWDQAESGRIPVSGAGYRGPFSGPGFDSMWTDMSEIVRPTRDGIHGREYINTSVDIGPRPMRLEFDAGGALKNASPLLEVMMPIILDAAPWGDPGEAALKARISAAAALKTLAVVPARHLNVLAREQCQSAIPLFTGQEALAHAGSPAQFRMVEIEDSPASVSLAAQLREKKRGLFVGVRLPLQASCADRVLELHEGGVSIIHLCADFHGRELPSAPGAQSSQPRFIKDVLRQVHGTLVKHGLRDQVTLIASGGIALAEHMAKAVICGADLVGIDIPLLVALGCHVCSACSDAERRPPLPSRANYERCPAQVGAGDVSYAAQRMVNLMGAWHSQLIEVLGAMGIREVRRLRGEAGRAMFQEDLERDAFKELVRVRG